ncbi:membrane hypothetical protein [metagenome]|uniref:Uncharacterized protein n=1 Tax=metagenome TaxID=256318 RepID=A0A2P2C956_9ZZZZ
MSAQALICPLCKGAVSPSSSGCRVCHLPMSDVERSSTSRPARGRTLARAIRVRLTGAILYCAAVAWCAYQVPTSLAFVVPGAVLGGGILHVWKGRPWLGLIVFTLVVAVVPALFWPSMTTGTLSDLTDGF